MASANLSPIHFPFAAPARPRVAGNGEKEASLTDFLARQQNEKERKLPKRPDHTSGNQKPKLRTAQKRGREERKMNGKNDQIRREI